MTSREKLYFALEEFVNGKYKAEDFSYWFTVIFDQETNYDDLTDIEYSLFSEMEEMSARFSPFEEDLNIPNVYFSEKDLVNKALEVYSILKKL